MTRDIEEEGEEGLDSRGGIETSLRHDALELP